MEKSFGKVQKAGFFSPERQAAPTPPPIERILGKYFSRGLNAMKCCNSLNNRPACADQSEALPKQKKHQHKHWAHPMLAIVACIFIKLNGIPPLEKPPPPFENCTVRYQQVLILLSDADLDVE